MVDKFDNIPLRKGSANTCVESEVWQNPLGRIKGENRFLERRVSRSNLLNGHMIGLVESDERNGWQYFS